MTALDSTPIAGARRRSGRRAAALGRIRRAGVVMPAFVTSRLLVLAAGAVGVLKLHKHESALMVRAARHALGPVGYVLSGSAGRFDAGYYLAIAHGGYGPIAQSRIAFFPLYPVLIRGLGALTGGPPVLSAIAISTVSLLVALLALHRLTELELGRRAADATVLLLAFAPLSFYFSAVYTESLFLALSVGALLAGRCGRWRLACALGGLATLTRVTGIVLLVGLAVMRIRKRGGLDRGLAWLAAIPAAFAGYMGFLVAHGYPALGMFSAQSEWHRESVGPVAALLSAIWAAVRGVAGIVRGAPIYRPTITGPFSQDAESVVLLAVLALAVGALVLCWRRLAPEYAIYATATLLMCLSSPEAGQPLWSVDRFILTIFPLWMAAGAWVAGRRLQRPALLLGSLALVFYTAQVASWAFVA